MYMFVGNEGPHASHSSAQSESGYMSSIHTTTCDLPGLDEFPLYHSTATSAVTTPLSAGSAHSSVEQTTPVLIQDAGVCAVQGARRKEQNRSA
ncbi:hypothetical protein LTR53_019640, partial [Teratosphaeriaceae sp. CCFEE 6253]